MKSLFIILAVLLPVNAFSWGIQPCVYTAESCPANAHTNVVDYSRDIPTGITSGSWSNNGTANAYDETGLDGIANTASTVTDDSAAAYDFLNRVESPIPADTNPVLLRMYIKKDADTSRFPRIGLTVSIGGTSQYRQIGFNTSTGASVDILNVGTTDLAINADGDWWEIIFQVNNDGSNTRATIVIYPSYTTNADMKTGEVAATGSIILGNVELYINKSVADVEGKCPAYNP